MSKAVAVAAENGLGKTALLEWIALSLGELESERWVETEVSVEIKYYSPSSHRYEYSYDHGTRQYIVDGLLHYSAPPSLKVVYVRGDLPYDLWKADDLKKIAYFIATKPDVVLDLVGEIQRNGTGFLVSLKFVKESSDEEDEKDNEENKVTSLYLTRNSHSPFEQNFESLSGSERKRTIVEFAYALARERARQAATLLLLDATYWTVIDLQGKEAVAAQIVQQPFQTIIVADEVSAGREGWCHYRIERAGDKSILRPPL